MDVCAVKLVYEPDPIADKAKAADDGGQAQGQYQSVPRLHEFPYGPCAEEIRRDNGDHNKEDMKGSKRQHDMPPARSWAFETSTCAV